jgi:ribosomal protein S18 acetylase RimI-like enzyme
MNVEYRIREMKENEYDLLSEFLYEAIFVPEGMSKTPKAIIERSELQLYIADFGKADDWCLVAETDEKVIGAAWVRIMKDYGHIDDETLSFAVSLYEEYRHLGIGTALVKTMLQFLKNKGYRQVSLSVQKANYAVDMYRKTGFEVIRENREEYIMLCRL